MQLSSDIKAERFELKGNRESIIEQASDKTLELILDAIHDLFPED